MVNLMTTDIPKLFNMQSGVEISDNWIKNNYGEPRTNGMWGYWVTGCCAFRWRHDLDKVADEENNLGFMIIPKDTGEESTEMVEVTKLETKSGTITIGARLYGIR